LFNLYDHETETLARELGNIVEYDRYQLSPRIQTLRSILNKIRPEPERKPLPRIKHYEPPRVKRRR
jgi:hypothetical protein